MKQRHKEGDYTLGLDIGMASVGAALLADDHIMALHVRTFDKAETAKEGESLNRIRREARLTRRRIRRRAYRLLRLRRLFTQQGLSDSNEPGELDTTRSPWSLRAEGLDRRLEDREWAAVLYHLVKHRGFQSNRKSEIAADEKVGQMLSGVSANQRRMQEGGWRTVGEMAALDPGFASNKRNKGGDYSHTFSRADLENELHMLFDAQRRLDNPHSNPSFEQSVHRLLMARRPTLSGDDLLKMVGRCTFEPDEFRAPKALHTAERFVWLSRLNNLRVGPPGAQRPLDENERRQLMDFPFFGTKTKLTYKQARKLLDLPVHERFNGLDYRRKKDSDDELACEGTTPLFEAKAFHKLRKAYEQAGLDDLWQRDALDADRLDQLAYAQTVFKEDSEARAWLTQQGVEPEIIEAVLSVSFEQFLRLSATALRKILPHLAQGLRYDEAVQAAGYVHHSQLHQGEKSRFLPPLSKEDFTNPVVYRSLNQARKLVNAIIREYGSPARVHIELARDLSRPFDERKRIEREQKNYRENKERLVEEFVGEFGHEPRKDQLTKWRLYREQDGKCAYSLNALDIARLFEDGYAEIDHALPYSRSFDDGMNNKVLVLTSANRDKGNRTPFEYLGGADNTEDWRRFQAFVSANPKYRKAKRDRLLRKDFSEAAAEGFRERHLTDTRYIARSFKNLVETHLQLAEGSQSKRCVVVSGQLTAFLRMHWGLNKQREAGDLHHALDAAVVAACSHGMVKRLSDYARRNELKQARGRFTDPATGEALDLAALRRLDNAFPLPWPHFRRELEARLSPQPSPLLTQITDYPAELALAAAPVRVSRAPQRRGTGQAHQETIRSAKWLGNGKSAVKTPLPMLKLKDLERIVGYKDPRNATLLEAIRQRLLAHGDDSAKAFKEPLYRPSKPGKQAPQVRSVNLLSEKAQKSGLAVRGGIADNGAMLRVDIFTDGKRFYAIPLYVADATSAELPTRAVVQGKSETDWTPMDPDKGYRFLFSLHPNDWVRVKLKGKPLLEGYFAGLDRSTGAISLWAHDRAMSVGNNGLIRSIGIKTALAVEKFHVDMLGRLYPAIAETRQPLHSRGGRPHKD